MKIKLGKATQGPMTVGESAEFRTGPQERVCAFEIPPDSDHVDARTVKLLKR
jgi:hypothetical protein